MAIAALWSDIRTSEMIPPEVITSGRRVMMFHQGVRESVIRTSVASFLQEGSLP